MVDVEVALLSLLVGRIDVGNGGVAIPFEECHLRIFSHDAFHHVIDIILHFGVGHIEH